MEYPKENPEETVRSLKIKLSSMMKELDSAERHCADLRHKRNALESTISLITE